MLNDMTYHDLKVCRVDDYDVKHCVIIRKATVDTGSIYTWIPARILRKLGISPNGKEQFEIMTGPPYILRDVGEARLQVRPVMGEDAVSRVVFGKDGGQDGHRRDDA